LLGLKEFQKAYLGPHIHSVLILIVYGMYSYLLIKLCRPRAVAMCAIENQLSLPKKISMTVPNTRIYPGR